MDKPLSELTYKVICFSVIPDFNWDECVDWAYEMLVLGYDTPNLLMLASTTKPADYYGTIDYFKATLRELNIVERLGDDAILFYSTYLIGKIAVGEEVKFNLRRVTDFHNYIDWESKLFDFYLLHWAWGDFDYGMDYQHYWEGATKDNIEQIAVKTAQDWLIEYENQLDIWALS